MILTFDTEKFLETGLGLYDYMMLVIYEKKDNYSAKELSQNLSITERTCLAKRRWLVGFGWLEQYGTKFYTTSKSKQFIAA